MHRRKSCISAMVYGIDAGYLTGFPMEYPISEWIPLNLPWECSMKHPMWQVMACTRGLTVGQLIGCS